MGLSMLLSLLALLSQGMKLQSLVEGIEGAGADRPGSGAILLVSRGQVFRLWPH